MGPQACSRATNGPTLLVSVGKLCHSELPVQGFKEALDTEVQTARHRRGRVFQHI